MSIARPVSKLASLTANESSLQFDNVATLSNLIMNEVISSPSLNNSSLSNFELSTSDSEVCATFESPLPDGLTSFSLIIFVCTPSPFL